MITSHLICNERIAELEAELAALRKQERQERRLRQSADSALAQALRHPHSKLDNVASYLYRIDRMVEDHDSTRDELAALKEQVLPDECGDCRYCVIRDDHIPGCDHPIGAEQADAKIEHLHEVLEQNAAELAALKARRCETCHYGDDHMLARCRECRFGDMWTTPAEAKP